MRSHWRLAIRMHAAEVAGAALRHDFGVPFGIIGRNAGFLIELLEEDRPQSLPKRERDLIGDVCRTIGDTSAEIYKAMRELGRAVKLRPIHDPHMGLYEITKSYQEINDALTPNLAILHRSAQNLERLLNAVDDKDILKYGHDIISNARRVQGMYAGLNYFFRLERLDSDAFHSVEFRELCSRTAKAVRNANELPHTIPVAGSGEAECIETQIRLVVQNLLQNSVKFTRHLDRPEVLIRIGVTTFLDLRRKYPYELGRYEGRGTWLEVHVEDNGPGIPLHILPSIFNLYYSRATEPTAPLGTGMGLAIARLVMTMHGGVIFVNRGSTMTDFVVLLPQRHAFGIDLLPLVKTELAL